MIEEYIKFDAEKFCKDYRRKKADYNRLQEAKKDALGISAVDPSRGNVQTSGTESSVETAVLVRAAKDAQLQDLKSYLNAYNVAIGYLDDEEKKIIDAFFNHARTGEKTLLVLENVGISKTVAYQIRHRALQKIKTAVISMM